MNPSGTNIPGTISSGGMNPGNSDMPVNPGGMPTTPVGSSEMPSASANPGGMPPNVPIASGGMPPAPVNPGGAPNATVNPGGFTSVNPGGMPNAPISSGGDIVLNGGAAGTKSKKGLIIVVILAILLIAGGLVAVVVLSGQPKTVQPGTAESEFNRYANYLLNGEDSTNALEEKVDESGEKGKPVIYSMVNPDEDGEESALYMQQLKGLWDGFVSKTGNFSLSNGLTKDDYDNRVKFLTTYVDNDDKMSVDVVFGMTTTKNLEEVKNAINNYTILFSNYNFNDAQLYASDATNLYENVAEMAFKLKDAGCIGGSSEEITCPEETYDGIVAEYESAFSFQDDMSDLIVSTVDYLVENCWSINEAISGNGGTAEGGNK